MTRIGAHLRHADAKNGVCATGGHCVDGGEQLAIDAPQVEIGRRGGRYVTGQLVDAQRRDSAAVCTQLAHISPSIRVPNYACLIARTSNQHLIEE